MKANVFLCLLSLILLYCRDDEASDLKTSEAQITGLDYTYCECCKSGYFILIDDDQYRVSQADIPESFNGILNVEDVDFPIPVRIQWRSKKDKCIGDEIVIKKISRIQASPI